MSLKRRIEELHQRLIAQPKQRGWEAVVDAARLEWGHRAMNAADGTSDMPAWTEAERLATLNRIRETSYGLPPLEALPVEWPQPPEGFEEELFRLSQQPDSVAQSQR